MGGEVRFGGKPAEGNVSQRAREGFAYITEERCVLMSMTCRDNLRLGKGGVDGALEYMPELKPLLGRRVGLLSGGEQQIVALGRALASDPAVIAADELSLGLAPKIVVRLLRALRDAANRGVAVLLVEQQIRRAIAVCDRGYVMRRGQIVMEGASSELHERSSEIESVYLASAAKDNEVPDGSEAGGDA
jgi:branched-chain amino acid transport system ATP-binding protein